jgi:endonuclease/exonuclease/phosphatase family metal-dependent hydrolase
MWAEACCSRVWDPCSPRIRESRTHSLTTHSIAATSALLRDQCALWLTPTFQSRNESVRNQIDHMFVARPLAKALVPCETGRSEDVFDGAVALSDHLPVVAEFG